MSRLNQRSPSGKLLDDVLVPPAKRRALVQALAAVLVASARQELEAPGGGDLSGGGSPSPGVAEGNPDAIRITRTASGAGSTLPICDGDLQAGEMIRIESLGGCTHAHLALTACKPSSPGGAEGNVNNVNNNQALSVTACDTSAPLVAAGIGSVITISPPPAAASGVPRPGTARSIIGHLHPRPQNANAGGHVHVSGAPPAPREDA
jgi:hypothetical protein